MKTLLVLRHAKASQDASFAVDFDRPLKPRGQRQSLTLGRMMRERNLAVDAIVASPAVRVVETITGVMEGAGVSFEPVYDRRLYNASPESLLKVIHEADDKVQRLLIVGHNPGLQHLLLHLAEDDRDGLRGNVAFRYPTATLAEVHFAVDRWREVGPHSGRIVSLVRPED
jgi:phosphohistidine phosphatase